MAEEQLLQLKQAESLLQQDPTYYPTIFPAVLALATQQHIPLRRWIANFLCNTFSSRVVEGAVKAELAATTVDTLRGLIEDVDSVVVKSCVQCSSLIYPLLFQKVYPSLFPYICPACPKTRVLLLGLYGELLMVGVKLLMPDYGVSWANSNHGYW